MTDPAPAPDRILVVDDEANIRRLVSDVLKRQAQAVTDMAEDGKKALEKIRERGGDYALVITDINMPCMAGDALIEAARAEFPALPFLVLTAHKNDRNVVRCLQLGAVDYLLKPISVENLVRAVRRSLDRIRRFDGAGEDFEVQSAVPGWVELTAPTDYEYVERFQRFTQLLGQAPLAEDDREDIRVTMGEIGQNAVEWGNRHDRSKRIRLSYCLFRDRIVFKVEDEGEGFDPAVLRDPSIDPIKHIMMRMEEGKRAGGYGVFLSRKLMDDILYNENGTAVLMTKFFRKRDGAKAGGKTPEPSSGE